MPPQPRLVAVAPTDGTYERLTAAVPGAPVERLGHLAALDRAQGEATDAVVFELGEAEAHPMAMITEAHARAPFAQIVFVGPAGALARARQTLLLVGGLTDQRTFLQADEPATWPQALSEAHDRAQRRRQLKAAIAPAGANTAPRATPLDAETPMPHLAGVLTHMQEAVLFLDLQGRITYANPAAERLYGRGADALRGTAVSALAPLASREAQDRLLASVRDGGPGGTVMLADQAPGGEAVALEVSVSPVRDWRGQLAGITLLARDVTERLAAERAAVAEARAQALQSSNEELSAQAEELEAQQAELASLYDALRQQNQRIEAEVGERTAELAARTDALQTVNEELAVQAEALAEREDELHRSNRALAAQVALTDRIIRHAPVVMAYIDRDLRYRWNNGVHSQLVGKPPAEVIGRHLSEVLPAETFARTEPFYRQVLESGEPFHTRSFAARMHGREGLVYLDMSYVPILDDAQAAQGMLIIAIDVTDRVERERLQSSTIEALKQADRTKDEFLSVISHELRTPLNFIMGFASTLEDEVQGPLNPAQREAIGKIMSGADRMVLLVDDLLDFARMQAGTFHLDAAATPFAALVEEVATTMRPLAAQKGLSIDTDVQGAFTPTLDGHRIVQVLTNLVSNAIKFTEKGHVSVRVRARDGELLTEVVDTGAGIAPQDIPRLFQRFQQLDMSQTRRVGGTGLGLAISKAIVEAHGGTIGVESEPGTGSTFWFALPL